MWVAARRNERYEQAGAVKRRLSKLTLMYGKYSINPGGRFGDFTEDEKRSRNHIETPRIHELREQLWA